MGQNTPSDYFAAHVSLRVRRVALDDIPGTAGKN